MHTEDQKAQRRWGAKLSTSNWHEARDYPAWANRAQQERWQEKGLILWDRDVGQITRLSAAQALQILDYIRTNDNWDQQDITVGQPAVEISLDHPEQESEQVLMYEMTLSPTRLGELLGLLERSESVLQRMKEEDEAERRRRLGQVYSMILGWGREASEEEAADVNPDED